MKFTEEQFNTLVRFQEDQYPDGLYFGAKDYLGSIDCTLAHIGDNLQWFIYQNNLDNEAVALMNPLTREWAHERFVEKEKKYYWSTKKKNKKGKPMTLSNSAGGIAQMTGTKHALTESEIREWGYDPERFDKEEVE